MLEHSLVGLGAIVALGVSAQWLAWKLHLPSILLLLLAGIIAGPVAGLLDPDALFGPLLQPVVALSVAVILFEGGLGLSLADLREIGSTLRNLVTIGVLVTWALSTAGAYLILGLDLQLAVLLGAILVVTGPTVIIPLLRHVRPVGQVGSLAKWEGILNDPIGAILAVLVFEAILAGGLSGSARWAAEGFFESIGAGCVVGLVGAGLIILALKKYWIPDFLQNAVSLMMVVSVFVVSNSLKRESGLLAATVMGIALANQKWHPVKHIVEFKENLRVLLISSLFVLLAARLTVEDLEQIGPRHVLFLVLLIVLVRPAAVWLSTMGSDTSREQRLFLMWMAPRGIVAAAVASIFAAELVGTGYAQAEALVPITFLVIIGTSAIYGSSAFWVARKLNLAEPSPQGALIVGAHRWARELAKALQEADLRVALVDSNWAHVSAARMEKLPAYYGAILSEGILDEVELYGIGHLLALTSNDEANSLSALHFSDLFGRNKVFQLAPAGQAQAKRRLTLPQYLSGRILFGNEISYSFLEAKHHERWVTKTTHLTEKFGYEQFQQLYGGTALPLFLVTRAGVLRVFTAEGPPKPKPGDWLIALIDARQLPDAVLEADSPKETVATETAEQKLP